MGQGISKDVQRYADVAMYDAEPVERNEDGSVTPKVYLLSMTADPLGVIAAGSMMYEGKVVRSLADVTHEDRHHYYEQIMNTHLKAPFELVDFHFMIEGVTRSFTHQMVRQRTAVFMQESLRFAVKNGMAEEVALPPSLIGSGEGINPETAEMDTELLHKSPQEVMRGEWDHALKTVEDAYGKLVGMGMPAEDARGLLPHNVTTRLHYKTNLRNLLEHAGNRLCTQAQFEWRLVWMQIVQAIAEYKPHAAMLRSIAPGTLRADSLFLEHLDNSDAWQYEALSRVFKPVCYLTGKCEFRAQFDRHCSIRNRVDANHKVGRPSSEWGEEYDHVEGNPIVAGVGPNSVMVDEKDAPVFIGAIRTEEWLLDPAAARVSM